MSNYPEIYTIGAWNPDSNVVNFIYGTPKADGSLMLGSNLLSPTGNIVTTRNPTTDNITASVPEALDTATFKYLYNPLGATWDRETGNVELIALASAARTASVNSADFTNVNCKGLHLIINITTIVATPTVIFSIQGKDPVSGVYYDILKTTSLNSTGRTVLKVYPGIGQIVNAAASDILPRTWRVEVVNFDADSITYSVGAQMVL